LRRFALVAGNDDGGKGTKPLLYARDDARKIHDILQRLGGVWPDDNRLVLNADAEGFLQALSQLERKALEARNQGQRTALFVFYSGHAKDGALRLGSSVIPLESLKARLAQAPADIRIAIFDACRSGALIRTKGARKAPAFEVESDASQSAKGLVILTSSASDEDSQESDLIGGSYFSHHLASGLLGDADRTGDGRVSVSEAYAYAYERTVADTAESAAGAQHPTFSYDLAGNGDVVLTDVAVRREGIRIPAPSPAGQYFLVDARGFVAAEVLKAPDAERKIALPPGKYRVKRRLPDRLRIGELEVRAGEITTLEEAQLNDAPFSDDPVKGTLRAQVYAKHWSLSLSGTYQAMLDTPTAQGGLFPSVPMVGLELVAHNFFGQGWTLGFDAMLGRTEAFATSGNVQNARYQSSNLAFGATLLSEWPDGQWVPMVGVRLALNLYYREFLDERLVLRLPNDTQNYYSMSPGLVAGLKFRITRSVGLVARARLHYLPYSLGESKNLGYLEVASLVTYEF
jgi:uncharacterized caspase-like protein